MLTERDFMRLTCILALFPMLALALPSLAQQSPAAVPQWQTTKKPDPSSGTYNIELTLSGRFVTAPHAGSSDHPTLVVTCNPDKQARGLLGQFISAGLNVNALLKTDWVEPNEIKIWIFYYPKVTVWYRVDGRKPKYGQWSANSEKTGADLDKGELKKLICDQKIPARHVENSVRDKLGEKIAMQLDMPDPAQMVSTYGIPEHK
jgi:hypothetical protein